MAEITIVGAGNVGQALSSGLAKKNVQTVLAVRKPSDEKYAALVDAGHRIATLKEGVSSAQMLILATPWPGIEATIAGLGDLSGKIVVDATNPIKADFSDLDPSPWRSGGEAIQALAPGARVVKAFNTVFSPVMADTNFGSLRPALAIATDDDHARTEVVSIAKTLGFDPYNAGGLAAARETERLAWHVINMGVKQGQGAGFTMAMLRR